MKRILILMSAAMVALTSCSKRDDLSSASGEQTVTLTAAIPSTTLQSRAHGDGTSVDRCIMEVYSNGKLYTRMPVAVSDKKATFELRLMASQTYDFLFWADKGGADQADNIYRTNNTDGLKKVEIINTTYTGNDPERDAFYGSIIAYKVDAGVNLSCNLTRPFGQLNVKTSLTDVPAAMYPNKVKVYYTSLYNQFNVFSGDVAGDVTMQWDAPVAVINTTVSNGYMPLSVDYVFAPSAGSKVADFKMEFYKDATLLATNDNFRNIPVQRNYKTNIAGELLTKGGTIEVTVTPDFDQTTHDITIKEVNATTVEQINNAIKSVVNSQNKEVLQVNMTGDITQSAQIIIPENVQADMTPSITLNFEGTMGSNTIQIKDNANYAGDLFINAPKAADATLQINMPESSVSLNGTTVKDVVAETAANTLIVGAESVITGTLTVKKGNVDIYGQVNNIVRHNDNNEEVIVNVFPSGRLTLTPTDEKISVKNIVPGIKNITNGKSYSSVRDAVEAAASGDVIELYQGNYPLETSDAIVQGDNGWILMINKSLTIKGIGNVTVYGDGYTTSGNHNSQSTIWVRGAGVSVTFENLTIMSHIYEASPEGLANKTVEVDQAAHVNVKNCTFAINNLVNGYNPTSAGGLYLNMAASANVENSTFKTSAITAGALRNETVDIKNCVFDNSLINTNSWDNTFDPNTSTFKMNISGCTFKNLDPKRREQELWVRAFYGTVTMTSSIFPTADVYYSAVGSGTLIVNGKQQPVTAYTVAELRAAIANQKTVGVCLGSDIDFGTQVASQSQIDINRPGYIFDGHGHSMVGIGNQNLLAVGANDVQVKNVSITNTKKAGMTVYRASGVKLDNVQLLNNAGAGLIVNGSVVEAYNLTVTGTKGTGAINLGQGKGVTEMPKLILGGENTIQKGSLYQIYADFGSGVDKSECLVAQGWALNGSAISTYVAWVK